MSSSIRNRVLLIRYVGTAAVLPSIANSVLFIVHTASSINQRGPFTAINTISTITSIVSTASLLVFTISPSITSSSRLRLLFSIPAVISSALCASALIWMTLSRPQLSEKIVNTPTVTVLVITFIFLLLSIILQILFWTILFFRPPQSKTPNLKGLPYTNVSNHNLRPYLPDIKIPPPSLDRQRSVVITVCDPRKGNIISQSMHTPKPTPNAPSKTPFRASSLSEQFRFSLPSIQNSIALPSPRRGSTPNHPVSKGMTMPISSCEAEVLDSSAPMTPRSLGLASVLPPTPAPKKVTLNTTVQAVPEYSYKHFDAWEPSSPSTAEVQKEVEAETKAAEAEERLMRSVGMGMAAKGKKRPENLKLSQSKVMVDGRECSPPLPKTPKTPGRRGSEQRMPAAVPIGRKTSMGGMGMGLAR